MCPRPQDTDTFEHLYQDEEVPIGDGLSSEYAGTFEAFEKLYQEEHVPMILDKLVGTVRSDQGRGDLEWNAAAVLPYRRDLFYVARGLAGVCAVRRRPVESSTMPSRSPVAGRRFFLWGRGHTLMFNGPYRCGTG